MESQINDNQHIRVKLIFNPSSGANSKSPTLLMNVMKEMQASNFLPEPFVIKPDCDLFAVVQDAIAQGMSMIVVCGGDGTISAVAKAIMDTSVTLGIIPTGTQNNVALSLNIPTNIADAVAILRTGQSIKVDVGIATCGKISTPFIEICSVGLFSTLLPSGDDIQHGNIARIGDFLATLTTSSPSEMHLLIEDKQEIQKLAHVVLISNMPYFGRHYQVGALNSYHDGLLDVLLFANLSKIELIDYVRAGTSAIEDPRIQHLRVRKVVIDTQPAMSIMIDGIALGEGSVQIEVRQHALSVLVSQTTIDLLTKSGEMHEK